MEKELLDYTLVPLGLIVMAAYHSWLLHRIVKHPNKTVIGINAINRRFWVRAMMEVSLPRKRMLQIFVFSSGLINNLRPTIDLCLVHRLVQDVSKNGVLAVQTLRNNIMASTLLASTAIMLSSLIALLMTGTGSGSNHSSFLNVLGDRSQFGLSIKFFSILVCFLVAFLFNVQSIRYCAISCTEKAVNYLHG